jgi:hypothetical protein
MAGAAVVGAGIGFVVGFKLTEKRLAAEFEKRLEDETSGMREFYQTVRKPYASPEEAVKDLIPETNTDPRTSGNRVQYNKLTAGDKPLPEPMPVVTAGESGVVVENVFDREGPRIITQDEFMANEPEHEQITLTYYEKSDQVCGESDEPIDNSDIVIGLEFKTNFGKDSSDPNVVHIRNDKLHMDFEVLHSEGSYEEEVLGVQEDSTVPPHKRVRLEGR